MQETFNDHERLYRKVIRKPDYWKTELGRPTSAVFKDSKGCSVDRDGGREDGEVVSSFIDRFEKKNIKAIVSITVEYCNEIDVFLIYNPLKHNPFHAEIHDSPDTISIRSSKEKKLARNSKIVVAHD